MNETEYPYMAEILIILIIFSANVKWLHFFLDRAVADSGHPIRVVQLNSF